jgi:hypothetical protein
MSPADFPLGSLGSRAAARALLDHAKRHKDEISPEDKDALTLYQLVPLLTSGMSPSYPELEATAAYKRGKELHERLHGPATLSFLKRSTGTSASNSFKMRFMREPVPGDVLRYQDVFFCDLMCYELFIAAWHRQIPELLCPLKVENDHMFYHQDPKYNDGQEWSGPDERALRDWCCVEAEANDGKYLVKDAPTIPAVVFLGIIDGEHKCRPATASEIQRQNTEIFFPETQEEQING